MSVLGIIMAEGGKVREIELWAQLGRIGAKRTAKGQQRRARDDEEEAAFVEQSAEAVLKEFIDNQYLERKRVASGDADAKNVSAAHPPQLDSPERGWLFA